MPVDLPGSYFSFITMRMTASETSDVWQLAAVLSKKASSAVDKNMHFTEMDVQEFLFDKVT